MESIVFAILCALGVYLATGIVLLIPMHRRILPRLDASADGASWGFRIVVSPGVVALWPVLLLKWRAALRGENPHGSPDRPVSSLGIRRLQSFFVKLLAITLPLLLAAALYTRPAPPTPSELPATETVDVR